MKQLIGKACFPLSAVLEGSYEISNMVYQKETQQAKSFQVNGDCGPDILWAGK